MKHVVLLLIAFIAVLLYVGELKITLHPFSLSLPAWKLMVAIICIVIGMVLYGNYFSEQGEVRGTKLTIETIEKLIKERKDEQV